MEALTLDELKALCKVRGLKISGNKQDLIDRLTNDPSGASRKRKNAATTERVDDIATAYLIESESSEDEDIMIKVAPKTKVTKKIKQTQVIVQVNEQIPVKKARKNGPTASFDQIQATPVAKPIFQYTNQTPASVFETLKVVNDIKPKNEGKPSVVPNVTEKNTKLGGFIVWSALQYNGDHWNKNASVARMLDSEKGKETTHQANERAWKKFIKDNPWNLEESDMLRLETFSRVYDKKGNLEVSAYLYGTFWQVGANTREWWMKKGSK